MKPIHENRQKIIKGASDEISEGENDMTIFEEGSNVIDTLPVDEGSAVADFKNHNMEFRFKFNQIPQSMQPNFGHRQIETISKKLAVVQPV